jgi:hypothetical protein
MQAKASLLLRVQSIKYSSSRCPSLVTLKVRSLATELVKKREGKKTATFLLCFFLKMHCYPKEKHTHIQDSLRSFLVRSSKGGTKRRAHQHTVSIAGARNHQAQTKNHTAAQRCACADMHAPVCFSFLELLATKSYCVLPNAQLFSQFL